MPAVITQNIDGLHQAAGVPGDRVIELHGNGTYALCLSCGRRHELERVRARFEAGDEPPACDACGGFVKSATISFGQAMPASALRKAQGWPFRASSSSSAHRSSSIPPPRSRSRQTKRGARRDREPRADRPRRRGGSRHQRRHRRGARSVPREGDGWRSVPLSERDLGTSIPQRHVWRVEPRETARTPSFEALFVSPSGNTDAGTARRVLTVALSGFRGSIRCYLPVKQCRVIRLRVPHV